MSAGGTVHAQRRRFLVAGGSLVMAFAIAPGLLRAADDKGAKLPGSLDKAPYLDAWIRIDADNRIMVFTGKVELGQGIKTALIQVAAEELQVKPARIQLITADTQRTPNEGYTAGSHSMQDSGTAIRAAAAEVRTVLVGLAAQRFNAPAEQLRIADGVVLGPGGARASYGELLAGHDLHLQATMNPALRDPAGHTIAGKPLQRVDIPAKVTGGVAYVHDLRPAGMVHGRIVRPPSAGAHLIGLDASAVERMPGVLKVVRDGRFIGVIADREYRAVSAAGRLARSAQWHVPAALPVQVPLAQTIRDAPSEDTVILDRGTPGAPGASLQATYTRPFQLHASIGPSCALALNDGGKYTVWTHSQGVYPLRDALAEMLSVAPDAVHCIHAEGAGCYGHNAADDVAADAALLARAYPGHPVRVQWMREDEHGWEPFGAPMVMTVRGTVDGSGSIVDWKYDVWSPPHNARPGKAGNLLAATLLDRPFTPPPAKPIPQPEGGGDRNAVPYYALPNARVTSHFQSTAPLRTSALRSLGAYGNVFAIESFMDELARAAHLDPVAFRLKHLQDPRAIDVVRTAAAKFGWDAWQRRRQRGRGFAFARYKNLAAYCALAVEVEVARDTGWVRIVRAVAAVDCGEVVNPDGVRNQIEGGIVQSCSWTVLEQVRFDAAQVLTRDWASYPILRFPQVPGSVEVHLLDRPGQPFLGTGEAAQGPSAAAIANAVTDACGLRLRDLPLDRERVRSAK